MPLNSRLEGQYDKVLRHDLFARFFPLLWYKYRSLDVSCFVNCKVACGRTLPDRCILQVSTESIFMNKLCSTYASLLVALLGFVTITPAAAPQAAPNEWTWIGGSTSVGQPGVYGTLGTPAPTNMPAGTSGASSWTDTSGNLWLFGGSGLLNQLWKFSPSTNEWTWMTGSNIPPQMAGINDPQQSGGIYGTLGVPSPSNTPGRRSSAVNWTDKSGNFWLFGGSGYIGQESGALNDLWEFSPATNQWTWISGSNTFTCGSVFVSCIVPGVYGTLGTPSVGNAPGGRYGAAGWIDSNGNLWLFGGLGDDTTTLPGKGGGSLNDLWKFNPSTKEWTWMGGPSTANQYQSAVYGTQGVPAAGNMPGIIPNPAAWTDKSGHFWLFGNNAGTNASEFWEFDPSLHEWAWMAGTVPNTCTWPCVLTGVYGTLGTFAPGNIPGPRSSAVSWTDNNGNLWLFGGHGFGSNGVSGDLNELWQFNPSTQEWAWMGGISTVPADGGGAGGVSGVYGTLGTPYPGNVPGARGGAVTWTDLQGNLWLFGGQGYGIENQPSYLMIGDLNDLWEYQPSAQPLPTTATPVLSAASGTYDTIQTISISDTTHGSIIYYTTDGTTPTATSTVYSGPINVSSAQTIQAIATASGCYNSETATSNYAISNPVYPVPVIASLSPAFAAPAGAAFTLVVNGTGFTTNTTVYWGTTALTTKALSATQVAAQVPAPNLLNYGITAIQVQNQAPGGGTSNTLQFEVDSAHSGSLPSPAFAPAAASVTAGSTASYQVTLPSIATTASASCLNLPAGASCSYSFSAGKMTISTGTTTPKGAYTVTVVFTETLPATASVEILLPFLLLPLLFLRRKLFARGIWPAICLGLVLIFVATFCTACGGGSSGSGPSTPPPPATQQVTSSAIVNFTVN